MNKLNNTHIILFTRFPVYINYYRKNYNYDENLVMNLELYGYK